MTNYEHMKSLEPKDLARFLCEAMEIEFYTTHGDEEYHCDHCIMQERCSVMGNGWLQWLMEEKKNI